MGHYLPIRGTNLYYVIAFVFLLLHSELKRLIKEDRILKFSENFK